ncbi:hypothetical protein PCL_01188 [Purpureocillium lilacinum]|uniref:Uncharacterized protein n=1 Tax=Purpureocillium lilacinum TaxID=33203 RepID=A0A2U3E4U9_PURLI|nr:hypothetical protein PCL_01188 [Purpureocillium lilacinum]
MANVGSTNICARVQPSWAVHRSIRGTPDEHGASSRVQLKAAMVTRRRGPETVERDHRQGAAVVLVQTQARHDRRASGSSTCFDGRPVHACNKPAVHPGAVKKSRARAAGNHVARAPGSRWLDERAAARSSDAGRQVRRVKPCWSARIRMLISTRQRRPRECHASELRRHEMKLRSETTARQAEQRTNGFVARRRRAHASACDHGGGLHLGKRVGRRDTRLTATGPNGGAEWLHGRMGVAAADGISSGGDDEMVVHVVDALAKPRQRWQVRDGRAHASPLGPGRNFRRGPGEAVVAAVAEDAWNWRPQLPIAILETDGTEWLGWLDGCPDAQANASPLQLEFYQHVPEASNRPPSHASAGGLFPSV